MSVAGPVPRREDMAIWRVDVTEDLLRSVRDTLRMMRSRSAWVKLVVGACATAALTSSALQKRPEMESILTEIGNMKRDEVEVCDRRKVWCEGCAT